MATSTVIYKGGLRTLCTHRASKSTIETDAPIDNQGNGQRFSPTDLVATALASCALTIMGIKARDKGIAIEDFEVRVTKTMASSPRRISAVDIEFHAPKNHAIPEDIQSLLEKAAHTCPVAQSLSSELEQRFTFHW